MSCSAELSMNIFYNLGAGSRGDVENRRQNSGFERLPRYLVNVNTAELQWLEHIWDHENLFETGVVRANEC